jgi:hypothetical protein
VEKSLQNKSYNLSLRAALCSPLFAQFVGAMQWELHEFTCLKGVGSLGIGSLWNKFRARVKSTHTDAS